MTEKQLITKLQTLKSIEPRKDWVILAKQQVFGTEVVKDMPVRNSRYKGVFSSIMGLFYQRKFAYALSVMAFVLVGVLGFIQYVLPGNTSFSVQGLAQKSQASLTMQSDVKVNFENFKKKSQTLAQIPKNSSNIPTAVKEVQVATKNLTDSIAKDPGSAKELAIEIKNDGTLLNIAEDTNVKQVSDVLYKTIDEQMIADLQKTTLTEDQQKTFIDAKALYDKQDYSGALEKILLIEK